VEITCVEPGLWWLVLLLKTHYYQTEINIEDEIGSVLKGTLSTVWFYLQTMFVLPISPEVENLTPSLVTEMTTTPRNGKCLSHKN
jgi:hypothetical protein